MSTIKILSKSETSTILKSLSLNDIINSSLKAFHSHSNNLTESPHRIGINCEKFTSLFMPSTVSGLGTTCKIVSIPKLGGKGLASSTIVFDEEGSVQWLINSELLTAVRTAAGSALTAKLLARKESEALTVFGSGIQAEYHIRLISQACPNVKKVNLINRTKSRAQELITKLKEDIKHLEFNILTQSEGEDSNSIEEIKEVVKNSQIIATCTPSLKPILLGDWVSPNTHICSVGSYTPEMHEFDNTLIQRSKLILVDSIDSANIEAGELILAQKSGIKFNMIELGKLIDIESNTINLEALLNQSDEGGKDLTLFKSVGIPAQDVTITLAIVQLAKHLRLGTEVEF